MKIRPLNDRIIIRRIEAEERSPGGIIIPDNAKATPCEGEVVAVGNGKQLDDGTLRAPAVAVGDRVLFGRFAETEVTVDGKDQLVVREDDILAVLED